MINQLDETNLDKNPCFVYYENPEHIDYLKIQSDISYQIKELKQDINFENLLNSKAILIFSTDFYLKKEKEIKNIFSKQEDSDSLVSIILVYRDDEIKSFDKKVEICFNSVLDEKLIPSLLGKLVSHELIRIDKIDRVIAEGLKADELGESLLKIGIQIGSRKDTISLLNEIIIESMRLTKADAGSLALVGFDKDLKRSDDNILTFYTSYNYSMEIEFSRFSLEINENSLAGYSVLNQKILNIPDAYELNPEETYNFNNSFDQRTGFRTKSILVVPMINNQNKVFGVIQLINKKSKYEEPVDYKNLNLNQISTFGQNDESNMGGIANFVSISLENAILYKEIETSFESFVRASVYAVEQRDPATSGHSDRVAGYCVSLAEACNQTKGELENFNFNEDEIRELRYAALLHDFGKIGVKEKVLVKQKKLEDYELKDISRKFEIYLLQKQLEVEKEKVDIVKNSNLTIEELDKRLKNLEDRLSKEYEKINHLLDKVISANEPTILEETSSQVLVEVNQIVFSVDEKEEKLLNDYEFEFLKIKRGSLSFEERKEIESHVSHSFKFLERIPWGGNLKNVPEIAYGHHEKLDGTGYPRGLHSSLIKPQTKIMTVSDIYDALVASDRPYKKALPIDQALSILEMESNEGKIDKRIVDLMVRSKSYMLFKK